MVEAAGVEPHCAVHLFASACIYRSLSASNDIFKFRGNANRCSKMQGVWQIIGKSSPRSVSGSGQFFRLSSLDRFDFEWGVKTALNGLFLSLDASHHG